MSTFVRILNDRYETDGVIVRSLTRPTMTVKKTRRLGNAGFYLRPVGAAGRPVFYNMNMIRDLMRNASAVANVLPTPYVAPEVTKDRAGNFIIGTRDNSGMHSVSTSPMIHGSLNAAKTEAERLAKNVPTKTFLVLEVVGEVQAVGVSWK